MTRDELMKRLSREPWEGSYAYQLGALGCDGLSLVSSPPRVEMRAVQAACKALAEAVDVACADSRQKETAFKYIDGCFTAAAMAQPRDKE